ncbi:MAG: gliding motility protein GldN [Bacteroidia bacterium]|jgi:gliding motility associated protien GldN
MRKFKMILVIALVAAMQFAGYSQGGEVIKPPTYPNGVYTKENSASRRPIPYTSLREADVMWSKRVWRVINLKEKINHPLYYPTTPIADRKSLFEVIRDGALKSGTVKCFNSTDDEFRIEFTKSEIENMLVSWDSSATTEDPNNPGNFISAPVKNEITSDKVSKYWIKEDWFYDKQRSVLDVRIIGLLVVIPKLSESGEDQGADKPLFWVYFPEIRPILATQEVYMRHNDAERRTLEDIFWKRMFSSYVIKESNVYDRYISEYTSGINALFESERVKEDIFKYEHDLWHF